MVKTIKQLNRKYSSVYNKFWEGNKGYRVIMRAGIMLAINIATVLFFYTQSQVVAQEPTTEAAENIATLDAPIVVDHNSVALFESIPEEYIQAAANLQMLFIDRSVGQDINLGLDCLDYPSDEEARPHCKRYEHEVDPNFSVNPSEVDWFRPGGYSRDNWDFRFWEGECSEWFGKLNCFFNMIDPVIDQYDVVSFQFSYLAVADGSTIDDQPGGYFWDNSNRLDVYDQEIYESQHSDKIFIYWTTSLSRQTGSPDSETFNNQMRQYAQDHGKILFDVADIISHDPDGNPCYDNRDGVPYFISDDRNENHPDDGQDIPAICQHYTSEVEGGHLYNPSAGKIRVAKAFWVLMAQIAGWSPGSAPTEPQVDLGINKQARTNQYGSGCFSPCNITYTLTIANAGSTFPITATVTDQWSPTVAVESIISTPTECTGNVDNGTITCNNINLTDTTPVDLEMVLETSVFTGALRNTATITLTDPHIIDPAVNNTDAAIVIINPELTYLPIIFKN